MTRGKSTGVALFAGRTAIAALSLLLFSALLTTASLAQSAKSRKPGVSASFTRANQGTVGIISGGIDSTAIAAASDLSHVLDNTDKLRIVPVVGKGSVQNISDLLYLRGIDIGIVQSDVLSYFKRTRRFPGIEKRIHYITKLYNEEFHVLANMDFHCIDDLGGRRVNFGMKGSGTAMTAEAVFEAHKVKIQRFYHDPKTALDMLKAGELDAAVFVAGKPSRAFEGMTYKDRVHFLDVTFVESLHTDYLPASLTHDDYPDLIAPQEKVGTVAVGSVMAVFNWKSKSPRYHKVKGFITAFFEKFGKLQTGARHPKWREVNLNSSVAGWTRVSSCAKLARDPKKAEERIPKAGRDGPQIS